MDDLPLDKWIEIAKNSEEEFKILESDDKQTQ